MRKKDNIQSASNEPVEIEPVAFRPDRRKRRMASARQLKWVIGTTLGLLLAVLGAAAWYVFTARQVVIQIQPEPEQISIQGSIAAPRIGEYFLMRPGEYRLHAVKPCFQPLDEPFAVGNAKSQKLTFAMTKQPGRVSITTHRLDQPSVQVEGARVLIDGHEIARTPVIERQIAAGRRAVEIRADNYQDLQIEMIIEGCDTVQQFNLAMVPGWSDITIDSIPHGASIRVDGQPVGRTPLQLQLPAGAHDLELQADRFKRWQTRLTVEANQPRVLEPVRLQPADGTLRVQTNPAGATVMLGDVFVGQSPLEVALGANKTYLITLFNAGYEKATREVKLGSGDTKTLTVELKPQMGVIQFTVTPADAEILIDGKSRGTVPRQLQLIAVEHELEIRQKGYQPYLTRITPRPGFPQEIKVELIKQASGGEAPAGMISAKNGYEMRLIRPQPFTMGSSRREQGRRSNETLRKIKLQRPFYMGIREVTNSEFRLFLVAHDAGTFKTQSLNQGDLPVVQITWEQAALFCNWLSAKDSLPQVYQKIGDKVTSVMPVGVGYRLPTEAEWEYCVRFSTGQGELKYPWGNQFPPPARSGNFADESAKDLLKSYLQGYNDGYPVTAPPAKFVPNSLGLFDMAGNTAEWCHDYYSIYPYDENKITIDPVGPEQGRHHVIRGASWRHAGISELRVSYRDYGDGKRLDLGLRICRYLE